MRHVQHHLVDRMPNSCGEEGGGIVVCEGRPAVGRANEIGVADVQDNAIAGVVTAGVRRREVEDARNLGIEQGGVGLRK